MTDLKPEDLAAIVQSVSDFANEPKTVLLDRNMPVLKADLRALLADRARMEKALIQLRDCDWTIGIGDRMDPVREIAREGLGASQ